MRSTILSIHPVPSRHGVHCPHDSCSKNRQMLYSTSTIDVSSSMTVTAAVPRPRQPLGVFGPSAPKSSLVSSSSAVRKPMLTPPGTTALAFLPFHTPPPCRSISSRAVTPQGSSTQHGLLTCPLMQYSLGP